MSYALVIVESPAKAKTIGKILGRGYKVLASMGHVRDLPRKSLGVDIENKFRPQYVTVSKKRDTVKKLKEAAQGASAIYLATDLDREGEAIAWHVLQLLKPPKDVLVYWTGPVTRSRRITREQVLEMIIAGRPPPGPSS